MSDSVAQSLGAALAGEHAAVYAYGIIGVHLTGALAADARTAESVHRARRDALVVQLAALGTPGPPGAAGYALPFPVRNRPGAIKLAAEVEERTAAVWRAALAETTGAQRKTALDALVDCALRATKWRRLGGLTPLTPTFPGRPT